MVLGLVIRSRKDNLEALEDCLGEKYVRLTQYQGLPGGSDGKESACNAGDLGLTPCDPMDCSPPGYSVHGIFLDKNTGMDCHFLLQGIFLTQGSTQVSHIVGRHFHCLSHQTV